MLKTILFLSILAYAAIVSGQTQLHGVVLDHKTGEPLAGATVKHVTSGTETITDFDGKFSFKEAAPGINEISISYVSYKNAHLKRVRLEENSSTELMIKMRRSADTEVRQYSFAFNPDTTPRT